MNDMQNVLSFDGVDDSINLGKKNEYKIEKNISLEAWIYVTAQKRWAGIIGNIFDTGSTESGYGLLLDGTSGIYFGLKVPSAGIQYASSGTNTINLNQWHHIAGTYDGQEMEMKVYVDGVEKFKQAIAGTNINYTPENDLLMGMYKDDDEAYAFPGKIAEVRLWNVTRSPEEIHQNMNRRLTGSESGLVSYWPLNEGSGNIVADKTSKGNKGTLDGATWQQAELPVKTPTSDEGDPKEVVEEFVEEEKTVTATGTVAIADISYKGKVKRTQSDEYVEIVNKGTESVDISGWKISSGLSKRQAFTFPAKTTLEAGKSCRVYTNEVHTETGGFTFGSSSGIWNDKGDEAKLFDAQGNQVSTLAYGASGIPGIKAELGVPQLTMKVSPSAINKQMAMGSKVTFIDALQLAIRSFLEDDNEIESPLSQMLNDPGAFDLPEGADKAAATKVLRSYLNQPTSTLTLQTAKSEYPPENGEKIDSNWIFLLQLEEISGLYWVIIDRSGAKAPCNYGVS
jgi:hypothetical protein